jgi:hypothetical protein
MGGGISILVGDDLVANQMVLPAFGGGVLETHGVTVQMRDLAVNILNVYNPNQIVTKEKFEGLMNCL